MSGKDWHIWKSKEDNPTSQPYIIVRNKKNEVFFARYVGNSSFAVLTCEFCGDMGHSMLLLNGFNEGDEWMYVDKLKNEKVMEANSKDIGDATIELFTQLDGKSYNWAQIQHSKRHVLVGMYEDGKVARSLFYMNKSQVKQLANTLSMLAETMEE